MLVPFVKKLCAIEVVVMSKREMRSIEGYVMFRKSIEQFKIRRYYQMRLTQLVCKLHWKVNRFETLN